MRINKINGFDLEFITTTPVAIFETMNLLANRNVTSFVYFLRRHGAFCSSKLTLPLLSENIL